MLWKPARHNSKTRELAEASKRARNDSIAKAQKELQLEMKDNIQASEMTSRKNVENEKMANHDRSNVYAQKGSKPHESNKIRDEREAEAPSDN